MHLPNSIVAIATSIRVPITVRDLISKHVQIGSRIHSAFTSTGTDDIFESKAAGPVCDLSPLYSAEVETE
jgi:hypothetical protein